jgi:hypothetical protein
MKNKITIFGLILQFCVVGALLAQKTKAPSKAPEVQKRPEVAEYCKVYLGDENLQISLVRVGPMDNNEVLFEVFGIDHPMNKKIFKAKVVEYNDNIDIKIKYEGRDWVIATKRGSGTWFGSFKVYLPNKGKKESEYDIVYSKDRSNDCHPEWLLTAYLEQK